ncbi:growth arrest and DNA damage-inducible protein GADD45 gamma-like [Macrosteles quadrilineatus]|uniref:growth arrest and DNA damage-inducible protein GADD45 gamma-like n=1 Tax=Macrosteles quadrilineatus TaxID=74068 RepID=UPI0023E26757|nr:growth arrest and DNA damage-inducible protein GADD45 gamma-like [Macrosteles quadrilineatus]XP_054278537.1 growth arrest and DNA damage-inducible protein GADD45 gamma-like [Macrosteles quadrilineatus]
MGIEVFEEPRHIMSNKELKRVGKAVSALLATAADEKRITCGLRPAIKVLEMDPAQILFCVMPHTNDAAKHIQSVLLEAFCYEHNIAIIKVDSLDRLRDTVGEVDCSCILIHRHRNFDRLLCLEIELERMINSPELTFVTQPVFKLPAK